MEFIVFVPFKKNARRPRLRAGELVLHVSKSGAGMSWAAASTTYKTRRGGSRAKSNQGSTVLRRLGVHFWLFLYKSVEIAVLTLRAHEVALFLMTIANHFSL